ncbi:MAG: hypothetical protein K5644_06490 [Lachnospiraceae bacterium]|nr:hypothetical protein [Lachnospiraceae bacterium]
MIKLIKRLKQLNQSLPLLLVGIIAWGFLVQITGVWFVEDKLRYSTGTWVGVGLAIFMAINMALVIESAVENNAKAGVLRFKSVLRYIIVVVVLVIMTYFNLGNWIPAFIAIMGLKVSAYAQPMMIKLFKKRKENKKEVKM